MFQRLLTSFTLAIIMTLASFQLASSQNLYHGYLLDSTAPSGTSWVVTSSTPLNPDPFEIAPPILRLPRGATMTAINGFHSTATGVYLQVNYNGASGWVDERFIRRASGGAPAPTTNVAAGVNYTVVNVNNWASLRQATTSQSTRLAKVPRGALVVTTGQQVRSGGLIWLSVNYSGIQGWMPIKFLGQGAVTTPGTGTAGTGQANPNGAYPAGDYRIVNVNNWASMRVSPSRSAGRVTTVPRNYTVYHDGQRSRAGGELWLHVLHGGLSGWMPVQYLSLN